jgi:hypothetical protein
MGCAVACRGRIVKPVERGLDVARTPMDRARVLGAKQGAAQTSKPQKAIAASYFHAVGYLLAERASNRFLATPICRSFTLQE